MSGQARPYSAAGGHHASASLSWTISGIMRAGEQTETSSSCRQSRRASAAEQARLGMDVMQNVHCVRPHSVYS